MGKWESEDIVATNIKKNVHILQCKACGKKHVVDKDMLNYSFECEDCKNEIYVDESGDQTIIGNLKAPETVVVDPENNDEAGKTKVDEKSEKPDEIPTKRGETNEFELMQPEKE